MGNFGEGEVSILLLIIAVVVWRWRTRLHDSLQTPARNSQQPDKDIQASDDAPPPLPSAPSSVPKETYQQTGFIYGIVGFVLGLDAQQQTDWQHGYGSAPLYYLLMIGAAAFILGGVLNIVKSVDKR